MHEQGLDGLLVNVPLLAVALGQLHTQGLDQGTSQGGCKAGETTKSEITQEGKSSI